MRITPLAVWVSNLSHAEIKRVCLADTTFVHANVIVQETIYVYVVAMAYLIRNEFKESIPVRCQKAFDIALDISGKEGANTTQADGLCVKEWLEEALMLHNEYDGSPTYIERYNTQAGQGFIKHGFILSFYEILKATRENQNYDNFYFNAIREIIKLGGDTDTNGCIVGGMVGAIVGLNGLDQKMLDTVLKFNCEVNEGHGDNHKCRPEWLQNKFTVQNINKLILYRAQSG